MTKCFNVCVALWVEASLSKSPLCKFGDHRPCYSRDVTDLIFQMTFQDQVIRGLCKFMEGSSSLSIPILPSLMATDIVVVDI